MALAEVPEYREGLTCECCNKPFSDCPRLSDAFKEHKWQAERVIADCPCGLTLPCETCNLRYHLAGELK